MVPRWRLTMSLATVRPIPEPCSLVEKSGSNTFPAINGSMPGPLSEKMISQALPFAFQLHRDPRHSSIVQPIQRIDCEEAQDAVEILWMHLYTQDCTARYLQVHVSATRVERLSIGLTIDLNSFISAARSINCPR
jgi:hypothetical protein